MAEPKSKIEESGDFKVADMSLWEFGVREMEIAHGEMPGLMACIEKYAEKQPFKGK